MLKFLKKEMSFGRDFIVTVINSVGIIIGVFLLNAYIARVHGLDILGEYLLIRRTVFSASGVILIGMNIGLPYYIAKGGINTYGRSALVTFLVLSIPLLVVVTILLKYRIINIFLSELVWSILIYSIGANLLNLVIGLYRGYLSILGASIISFIGSILIPVVIFIFFIDLTFILQLIGIVCIIFSLIGYFIRVENNFIRKINYIEIKRLLKFGLKRFPSFFAEFFLLAGVPLLLYNEISKGSMAYLNSSISLIRLVLVVIGPFGFIVLPRVSKLFDTSKKQNLVLNIRIIIAWSLFIGVSGMLLFLFFGPIIIKYWLGEMTQEGIFISRYLSFSLPLFMISSMLRSIIDAASVRGYNSMVYSISVFFLLLVYFILKLVGVPAIQAGIWGFNIGYIFAGLISIFIIQYIFKENMVNYKIIGVLLIQIFLFSLLFVIVTTLLHNPGTQLFVYTIILTIGFLFFFKKSNQEWIVFLRTKVRLK